MGETFDDARPALSVSGLDTFCSRRPGWLVCDQSDDLRVPLTCDAYRCPDCGPRKAFRAAVIASWAIRESVPFVDSRGRELRGRFITLTQAAEDWQRRRGQVRDLRRRLTSDGYRVDWAWTTEKGKRNGMIHVHLLQHGDYISQGELQDAWGGRRVDIRAIDGGNVAGYVTKDALSVAGYVVKGRTAHFGMGPFLDLNGGRAMHWSRGFLHGLTKREASKRVSERLVGDDVPRTWRVEGLSSVGDSSYQRPRLAEQSIMAWPGAI